jgi:hypothetical protein
MLFIRENNNNHNKYRTTLLIKKYSRLEKLIRNILNNDNEGYSKVKQRSSKPFLQKINK